MGTPQTIELASLGMWDSLILMVMALVVFGPRRLPEIGRQIGRLMYEIRKASNDFKFQMEEELRKAEDADRRKKEEERLAALALAAPNPSPVSKREEAGVPVGAEIPKWTPGAPVPDGQFPVPSPYPEEGVYPAISPAEYQVQESIERMEQKAQESMQRMEDQAQESTPRIQPPSTGEQIAAARPGAAGQESNSSAAPAEAAATADETNATTEQANHG